MDWLLANPEVAPQRDGWCVYDERNNRWLSGLPTLGHPLAWGSAAHALVYESGVKAAYQASVLACVLTTVPRFNGHVFEWSKWTEPFK